MSRTEELFKCLKSWHVKENWTAFGEGEGPIGNEEGRFQLHTFSDDLTSLKRKERPGEWRALLLMDVF